MDDLVDSCPPGRDWRAHVLAQAAAPVRIIDGFGRKQTVSTFEARLLELVAGKRPRRVYCEDFIWLVLRAASMTPDEFNAEGHREGRLPPTW